jgi:AraC-like DNA-binding protein
MSPLVAGASAALAGAADVAWEELAVRLATRAAALAGRSRDTRPVPAGAEARVTAAVRRIEQDPGGAPGLGRLADEVGLSPYYFLRTFLRLTGVTPHQYVLRARLREAATRLTRESSPRVIDIAFESGFGDVSNFNRAFRAEFGVTPRTYRQRALGAGARAGDRAAELASAVAAEGSSRDERRTAGRAAADHADRTQIDCSG